ncbi:hypothetical protein DC429_19065 [Arthrobacter sp. TPD3018]|nr:hypothetical protein DC429_19065 [Arthrobacter sp. TPD3018]
MRDELKDNLLPLSLEIEDVLERAVTLSLDEVRLTRLQPVARRIFEDGLEQVAQRPADLAASGILS